MRIGKVHTRWVWGRLRESAYFDADAANDSRFITGLVASFSPAGLSGLELGASRVFVSEWEAGGPSLSEALVVFLPLQKKSLATPDNPDGDDRRDQIASLFFRWALPASGFEFYGEWARGDHSRDLRDLFLQPEHASGYLVGFQKGFERPADVLWRFGSEITVLGSARTAQLRAPASAFYVHHLIHQGYTQRGQVMGAGIGPGSSQLWAGLDRFARWGKVGAGVQRTVLDNNRFYSGTPTWLTTEVESTLMADALLQRERWDLTAAVAMSNLLNKHYVERNDERNLNVNLSARYHFGAR